MGIESACIPLPRNHHALRRLPRVHRPLQPFWAATAGAIGCNLGSIVAYWVGAWGGRPLVLRYGRWVLMSPHDLDRITGFFEKYGGITVLLGRLLPWSAPSLHFRPASQRCRNFASTSTRSSAPGHGATSRLRRDESRAGMGNRSSFSRVVPSIPSRSRTRALVAIVWFLWTHIKRVRQASEA